MQISFLYIIYFEEYKTSGYVLSTKKINKRNQQQHLQYFQRSCHSIRFNATLNLSIAYVRVHPRSAEIS